MNRRNYQITLINWLTRTKINLELGQTIEEAKEKLKVVRKKYGKLMWRKATPINC
jgi:hypothetical protein